MRGFNAKIGTALAIALALWLATVAAQEPRGKRLIDEQPYDVLTLDKANDNKIIKVEPLDLPERKAPERPKAGDKVQVGIRPEHFVDAADAPVKMAGRAQVVEQLGGVSYVYAAGEGGAQLTVQQRGHSSMATDTMVEFGVDPKTTLLFDADGRRI